MPLRLTLRTLLAYLDDTLEAAEIKEIGQKVAESDQAQEQIARIKQVTRRRRLTVPPTTGPGGMDPNDVAEYLDNVLPSDRIPEVEKAALESDVHLAEVAACHQILTLVLGEPALVPPTAKERMYGLVHGREAIPYRKAQAPKKTGDSLVRDQDELGLSAGWLRWVLPAAALLLIVTLGLAIYLALPGRGRDNNRFTSANRPGKDPGDSAVIKDRDTRPGDKGGKVEPADKGKGKTENSGGTLVKGQQDKAKTGGTTTAEGKKSPGEGTEPENPAVVERTTPPSKERRAVATYQGGLSDLPTALLSRQEGKDAWQRLDPRGLNQAYSTDTLVTLPGFVSVLQTRTGVGMVLRGNVRDFALSQVMYSLMDSAVVLHASDRFDLDLTLLRGRVFLTNQKDRGPCKVRLRFQQGQGALPGEVWDVTLADKGHEVGLDLVRGYTPTINYRKGEEPRAQCYLAVLLGEVGLKTDPYHSVNMEVEPPRWKRVEWDSSAGAAGQPFPEDRPPLAWAKQPPSPDILPEARQKSLRAMNGALKNLEVLLGSNKAVDQALRQTLKSTDPAARQLAVYGLAAIDQVGKVIEVLDDEEIAHAPDREAAMYALQQWISRSARQGKVLYDEQTGMGLLIDRGFRKRDAEKVYQLLHPVMAEDLNKVETYHVLANCLQHPRVAIAELGFWHLVWLSGGARLPGPFNAALPIEDRKRYAQKVQELIDTRQLPAAPPSAAPDKEKPKDKESGS